MVVGRGKKKARKQAQATSRQKIPRVYFRQLLRGSYGFPPGTVDKISEHNLLTVVEIARKIDAKKQPALMRKLIERINSGKYS